MTFDPTASVWRARAITSAKAVGQGAAKMVAEQMEAPEKIRRLDPAFADEIRLALMTGFVDGIDKSWMGAK